MSPDERALLAAVCAAPADDTPRLVYADWLDENGNPARAAFIRLQVEADRLHPDSNRRGLLEAQAERLFAANWLDWWAEVCESVGLPLPERSPQTRLGRLARRLAGGRAVGLPYWRDRFDVHAHNDGPRPEVAALHRTGFARAGFRRGFSDVLETGRQSSEFLAAWPTVAPIREFLPSRGGRGWVDPDGPHLGGVCRLVLSDYEFAGGGLALALASPHLDGLTELRYEGNDWHDTTTAELAAVAAWPGVGRLRQLEVPLPDQASADVLAGSGALGGLTALHVELEFEPDISGGVAGPFPPECDRQRLERLARSPYLAGLTELHVSGVLSAAGVRALVHRPAWAGLRTLTLNHLTDAEYLGGLAEAAGLDDLIDLRVAGLLSDDELRLVARLPVLRRLRHLNLWPPYGPADADLVAVADALDPGRLETLALRFSRPSPAARAERVRRFGDRVRLAEERA